MPWSNARPNPERRGYGKEHRAIRAAAIAELERNGVGICCIGGEPIYPGQALHLDHTPDRTGYRGLACARHNRSDGARRGRARQNVIQLRL
jgi:hypothetical protein